MPDYRTRFWSKVQQGSEDECWEWKSGKNPRGYGQFWRNGKGHPSNRMAWEYSHGEIPPGLSVCHSCDNPGCCNPKHLWLGTHLDNARDRTNKRRGAIGERSGRSSLTNEDVRRIRADTHLSTKHFAQLHHLSTTAIYLIRKGINWKYLDEAQHIGDDAT